eukprot:11474394-Alexandrium_andersonii.AAC.1
MIHKASAPLVGIRYTFKLLSVNNCLTLGSRRVESEGSYPRPSSTYRNDLYMTPPHSGLPSNHIHQTREKFEYELPL